MLREVVEIPLLHPERFATLGIDPPKGVLLYGPPGTGKTLTARAVANRTDATFIRVIGSELVQRYVGEGARMVRELFSLARSKKTCIIFFDEVDAIGGSRSGADDNNSDNEVQCQKPNPLFKTTSTLSLHFSVTHVFVVCIPLHCMFSALTFCCLGSFQTKLYRCNGLCFKL
jgi:ATP-dependent Zn protease